MRTTLPSLVFSFLVLLSVFSCKEHVADITDQHIDTPIEEKGKQLAIDAPVAGWNVVLNKPVTDFAFDSDGNLYYLSSQKIFISDKYFTTIDTLSLPPIENWCSLSRLFISENNIILLGLYTGFDHFLLVSADRGKTWHKPETFKRTEISKFFSKGNRIYVTSYTHDESTSMVQISEDNGATWKRITSGRSDAAYYFCKENDSNEIFYGLAQTFYYSNDYGKTFTENKIPYENCFYNSLAFGKDKNLLLANFAGVFLTPDYGASWMTIYIHPYDDEYFNVFNSPDGKLFLLHCWERQPYDRGIIGVYVSNDGGFNWYKFLSRLDGFYFRLTYKLNSDGYLYIIASDKYGEGIYRSSIPLFN